VVTKELKTITGPSNEDEAENEGNDEGRTRSLSTFDTYDPNFLDDPDLTTGKHRTVLNLASFRSSIFPFVKEKDLQKELNDQFHQRHPWMQPGVTLYKIRKLKKKLLDIGLERKLELSSVALAYVCLDKLLIQNLISKENLKLYGAICFFLAVKFNDQKDSLLETIEKHIDVEADDILSAEFDVFTKLSFSLFVNPEEVLSHASRLQANVGMGSQDL